jgi:CheY-like chemotaxis protein
MLSPMVWYLSHPFDGIVGAFMGESDRMQTILVVDDEVCFLNILEVILQRAGYRTLVALDGLDGLKLIYEQHPDLVVLDDMLPGISGSEICTKIKHDRNLSGIPVILYSAGLRIRDSEFVKQTGANGILNKPFRPNDVIKLINSFLQRVA